MALLALTALCMATTATGDEHVGRRRPDVDVLVPLPDYDPNAIYWKRHSDRDLVPGTVTINRPPWVCDADGKKFDDREHFVAHLLRVHRVPKDQIPDLLYTVDGEVHFDPRLAR